MYRPSLPIRPPHGRRFIVRGAVLVAVVGVAMLGNLRSQASEMGRGAARDATASPSAKDVPKPIAAADANVTERMAMVDSDGVDDRGEDVRLVPAIYAWNPDVRFVYFRHVSKWM